ncbi:hypothetical protein OG563_37425 [Nocardia vinacea]|uniref:Low molecular weight antigen MTB12-like C-terminal domain-containing protein n=1 Tax=Nocardia vinacea TaxID=96468 RepID=A0ABZ1YNF4_9NOCA|nr:hypothetical protein [Nocardia vinacea]
MRIPLLRSVAACCGSMIVVGIALTGCSSDDDAATTTTTSVAAKPSTAAASAGTPADAATTTAVTDAYIGFFDAATPADQRLARLEKAEAFAPALQAQASSPQGQGTSVTVSSVKLTDPTHAAVTYTLLLGGNPVLPDQAGIAVKEGEQWKIAASTFCSLLTLQGGTASVC